MGITMLIIFCGLMALGVPIAVALGLGSMGAIFISGKYSTLAIIHKMIGSIDSFILLAIPFFVLAGQLMNTSGITDRIFRFAKSLVGHIPGGLAHANIIGSIIFSGMSGSAIADAAGLGQVEMKAMIDEGYDPEFSAAITAASATVGPIIPPSIPMVLYGAMAEVSVGALFLGGFIPGLLLGVGMMILVYFISIKRKYLKSNKFDLKEVWESFKGAFLAIITPIIIIGGILLGVFTPTEAAVVATVYAFVLGFIVYREMTLAILLKNLINATVTTSSIIFILSSAAAFSWVIALEGIPQAVTRFIQSTTQNPYMILLILNVVFLVLGMFMESLSILVITVPFLSPLIKSYGFDPVHIGVMVVLNLMLGLCTPPVGMSLFVCSKVGNIKLEKLYREILPFLVPLIAVLFIIAYVPVTVTFVPDLLLKR